LLEGILAGSANEQRLMDEKLKSVIENQGILIDRMDRFLKLREEESDDPTIC
jgi:hypothetical protein